MEYFNNKTVVVTGAAGFVGSHLCDRLVDSGATVIGVDNLITGSTENLASLLTSPHFTFIEADVTQVPTTFLPGDKNIDCILHFASPASPPRYQQFPIQTYLVNSLATHNLLQYLKNTNPNARFLFASTSEVYGDPQVHPQPESYWGNVNPNGKRSCYDEAKRLGETICGVHQRDFGMDVRIVRIFNTYGPRMDINDGRVIPNFIKESLAGEKISIYGDGSQTRSYCYIDDLVDGILLLASKEGLSGRTVNLGNPGEFTILETAHAIWRELHGSETKPELVFNALPEDDPLRRRPDITRARELLGWEPTVNFSEGLAKTIKYFQENRTQSPNS